VWFPDGEGPKCNIFMSQEFINPSEEDNKGKTALVLIQGSGAVRAGEWARSICLKDDLFMGSMLPQLEWAKTFGHPVLIMNPNYISSQQKEIGLDHLEG
jgi:hypothetical protein